MILDEPAYAASVNGSNINLHIDFSNIELQ